VQFYSKWVDDISDAQNKETGFVSHTVPFNGGGGGLAWGCALIIVPWLVYMYYGDVQILEKHYNAMQKWVEYLSGCTDDCGIIVREELGS
jgi:Bacterial alpha-L-rhamnosidase.